MVFLANRGVQNTNLTSVYREFGSINHLFSPRLASCILKYILKYKVWHLFDASINLETYLPHPRPMFCDWLIDWPASPSMATVYCALFPTPGLSQLLVETWTGQLTSFYKSWCFLKLFSTLAQFESAIIHSPSKFSLKYSLKYWCISVFQAWHQIQYEISSQL